MITRKEYMERLHNDNPVSHREYHSQFVNEYTKDLVLRRIGIDRLLKSTDEHLNDIPLKEWDMIGSYIDTITLRGKLKERGDFVTPSILVCIGKEAAKQIIDEAKKGE